MGTKFGKQYPLFASRGEKERLLFVAAAGLFLSLLIITLLVVNFKPEADAREIQSSTTPSSQIVGTVSLLAPERAIPAGTKLSGVKFKEVFWPRNQVPEEAIRDVSEFGSFYAKTDLPAGFPVQRASLTNEPTSISLSVAQGMRAVSIDVDATSSLEGHALPGTRVDIVLTYHEDSNLTSKVIVQNARVLSYGGDTKRERSSLEQKTAPQVSKTITLEVTTENALKIQTARQMGRLSLIMRALEDDKAITKTEIGEKEIDDSQKGKRVEKANNCTRGKMKMAGKEYVIGCDGGINEVVEAVDP